MIEDGGIMDIIYPIICWSNKIQDQRKFYIDGQWVSSIKAQNFDVINPATEKTIAVISLGGQADTNAAVAAAKNAFSTWSCSSKEDRLALLERIRTAYTDRIDDLAIAMSQEMGAPIDMATSQQASSGLGHIEEFIRTLENFDIECLLDSNTPKDRVFYEPIGVCALITPWNWPMNQITLKVIPAIAAGCTMVLKPSEISPLSAMIFAEIMHAAKTPLGVFNMLNGDGTGVGTQLSTHPDVDMVSFTGSTRAAKLISKNAAETHKRVHLELGGKGANIIFNDADDKAVERGVIHCFENTGQSCNAPTRMLVQRDIYNQSVETAATVASACDVGPTNQPGDHFGPLVSKIQFEKVQSLIQAGIDEGARLVTGGLGKPAGLESGYYVRPTVFADVSNDMSIAQQEIFGPVLSIIPFDTEEDAVRIANDTPYGLSNYIQSQDAEKCQRIARKLRSGMVDINGKPQAAGAPFGGIKASGNGREGGRWGLLDFMEIKSVSGWRA